MSGTVTDNPTTWNVDGNILDETVSNPTGIEPFTVNDCTVTLESAVVIDGHSLIPLLIESDWPE